MNQPLTHCPQCGAAIKKTLSGSPERCTHCGSFLPRQEKTTPPRPTPAQVQTLTPTPAAASPLPPEYSRLPRPKPTGLRESVGCILIFGLIWTLFSAIFPVVGVGVFISEQAKYNQLSREGVTAKGMITELDIDNSGDSTSYYVSYQFTASINGDPTQVQARESVSSSLYNDLETGQKIDVLYAASDPNLSTLKAEFAPPNLLFSLFFVGFGGLFVLFGLGMMYGGVKAMRELNQLRSSGRQVQGIIFDRWQDTDSDGDPTYFVAYAFKVGPAQQIVTAAEQNKKLHQKYQIGDSVTVRYVPSQPTICQVRL
ncbi:MAG: DUF3592 domain-containing protein [Chloroflexota bacterium]